MIDSPLANKPHQRDPLRFHRSSFYLLGTFGNGWFGGKAEKFARLFGTPFFLGAQTFLVILWIASNTLGFTSFDLYPFILLNLAFSVQAAYAAPLILLAQTRQAERDKAIFIADAKHREKISAVSSQRQEEMTKNTLILLEPLKQNNQLTQVTNDLSQRIENLTLEIHTHILEAKMITLDK